jgi:hypothetical protein
MQEFIEAISRGEAASKAIPEITGCSRNGKEPWNSYYLLWKEIEVKIKAAHQHPAALPVLQGRFFKLTLNPGPA